MKKKQIFKIIWITVGVCLGVFLVLGLVGVTAYNGMIHQKEETPRVEVVQEAEEIPEDILNSKGKKAELEKKQLNKTIAVLGTDKDGVRTDVIFVAHFTSETNQMDVISIPRDTKVDWKSDQKACLPSYNQWVKVSKINEMTHYSQMENIKGTVINEIEAILGVKVDHYVMISLDAFRKIVDAVGGVEIDVKQRMKWNDYSQDLHIDLHPGLQHMDGEKAEQFVRFRNYPEGDVDRIKAQQQFLEAFAKQVMTPKIIAKIPQMLSVIFTSVKTDMALDELIGYYPYLKGIDINDITFHTLPGVGAYENKISYYFKDMEEIEALVNDIFFEN